MNKKKIAREEIYKWAEKVKQNIDFKWYYKQYNNKKIIEREALSSPSLAYLSFVSDPKGWALPL